MTDREFDIAIEIGEILDRAVEPNAGAPALQPKRCQLQTLLFPALPVMQTAVDVNLRRLRRIDPARQPLEIDVEAIGNSCAAGDIQFAQPIQLRFTRHRPQSELTTGELDAGNGNRPVEWTIGRFAGRKRLDNIPFAIGFFAQVQVWVGRRQTRELHPFPEQRQQRIVDFSPMAFENHPIAVA